MALITSKRRARIYLIQALYQWQLCNEQTHIIEQQFLDGKAKVAKKFFINTWQGIVKNIVFLKTQIQPHLDHPIEEISLVDLSILYLAVYELHYHLDISSNIILNEAIELTKQYGTEEGYRFINHLLDKINKNIIFRTPTLKDTL